MPFLHQFFCLSASQYESLVSSGFTSPVIAGMVLDRNMKGALEIAGNLRQRHDGRHRSPWNEPECGLLYSRAMAHWNIFDQACGHIYDCHNGGSLSFDPRSDIAVSGGQRLFKCFYTVEGGWGNYSQTGPKGLPSGKLTLSVAWGTVTLKSLGSVSSAKTATATVGTKAQAVTLAGGVVTFTGGLTLAKGEMLTITLGGGTITADPAAATCDGTLRQRHSPSKLVRQENGEDAGGCCPGGVCAPGQSCCEPAGSKMAAPAAPAPKADHVKTLAIALGCFLLGAIAESMLGNEWLAGVTGRAAQ